jgi:hypothetical protein
LPYCTLSVFRSAADEYIANCIQKLNPSVGCEGAWDSPVWGTPRDTYDDGHPELDIWPPE